MSSRFDLIAQQFFQKDFEHCSIDELYQYADAHPYLAAVQFLLVKKLQLQKDPAFKIKAQKAALYYHQPVAFEAFLLAEETEAALRVRASEPVEAESISYQAEAPAVAEAAFPEITEEGPMAAPVPVLPKLSGWDAKPGSDVLTFEPYHMVDYFASQGIKLTQEELPKDQFGKQLMSFTAWLKTMKKIPAGEGARSMDPQAEQKVEHLAAHSISSSEVVTETMAEVWIKQGQPAKAAEVYRKLSLLHPSKKAYFAAKLQNLKY